MLKRSGTGKAGREKGFYIVLFLCAAVLGTSSWIALAGTRTHVEEAEEQAQVMLPAPEIYTETEESLPVMAEAGQPQPEQDTRPASVGYVSPVEGGVQKPFSVETLLYDATMQDWRTHAGVDYACADGTAVVAAADGVVADVFNDGLLGTTVTVDHPDGMQTVYCNLAEGSYVRPGDGVFQGQVLGSVGSTAIAESCEACHLHFAMNKNGVPVDPGDYIG